MNKKNFGKKNKCKKKEEESWKKEGKVGKKMKKWKNKIEECIVDYCCNP